MGQASQAAHILAELEVAAPAFTTAELRHEAKVTLTVQDKKQTPRTGYPRWQRDGFMFEAISWIAARQEYGSAVQMKDPHVSSTSQGIDELMLELPPEKTDIDRVTIFEDKCTDDPVPSSTAKSYRPFKIVTTTGGVLRWLPPRRYCSGWRGSTAARQRGSQLP
jgi:hypothetical protein